MKSLFINWMREVSQRHLSILIKISGNSDLVFFLFFHTHHDISQSLNTDTVLDTGTRDVMKEGGFLSK